MMVGREIANLYPKPDARIGEVVLRATNVTVPGRVHGCSLEVRAGEVVGLAGIVGAGRSELARAIFGAEPRGSARVELHGAPVAIREPHDAIRAGIGYVTEDRKGDGLALELSVLENISLVALPTRAGFIDRRRERERATAQREALRIRTASLDRPVQVLSGGNQQKVMLARWLEADTSVLFFDEPGRGVDIGAKAEMFELIGELAKQGKAVVIISSYLPELLNMCDRIVVMRDGAIAAEVARSAFSEEHIVGLATSAEVAA
jgi:ABC-type sugar transport system ATPase subunit